MQKKPSRLIIEDEEAIRSGLVDVFLYHGYAVDTAADGNSGLAKALAGGFDLILLDIMLPGMNGFEVCNRLRAADPEQPVIMLTARSGDEDIIQGLSLGADDYVAKPFSVTQLVLRVKAVLRRVHTSNEAESHIRFGEYCNLDCLNLCGHCGDRTVAFTRREVDIVQYLNASSGRPVSREELLTKVWGYAKNLGLETRTIDIHIAKLRRKIEPDPGRPRFLVTVRGAGYRLQTGE